MLYRIFAVLDDFSNELNKNNVGVLASSAAFFIFLSLIPILLLICSIVPYTMIKEVDLIHAIKEIVPMAIAPTAVKMVTNFYNKSPAVISIAAITTVWSAAKGILALMRGLNSVCSVNETRNYILLRLRACLYTIIMLVIIVFSLFIMVFGNVIAKEVNHKFPQILGIWKIIMSFRFLYVWILLTILFALLYTWIPNKKMRFKFQLPGALFGSIVWSAFTWGFSMYVEYFNTFSVYGSLTTIVITMLWIYICMYIILIGAEVNRYFNPTLYKIYKRKMEHKKQKKK